MDIDGIKSNSKWIILGIGILFGIIFVLQNFEQTSFQFLIWTLFSGPKWIIVSGTFLIGLGFGYLMGKKNS
jgi:uncharacterized integral membrane protein